MSVLANRSGKSKVKPVGGACRWLVRIGETGMGALEINGTAYVLTVLKDGNTTAGYRMEKSNGTTYDIDATAEPWTCDCKDYLYRRAGLDPKGCKHIAGLKAALAAAGK